MRSKAAAAMARLRAWGVRCNDAVTRHPVAAAVGIAALAMAVALLGLTASFDTNDDPALQGMLDGTDFGVRVPHMVFGNVLIGLGLSSLYGLAGAIPWYALYLCLLHWAALAVLVYCVLSATGPGAGRRWLSLAAAIGVFQVPMWIRLQFTSAGLMLGLSGVLLFLCLAGRARARLPGLILAGVLAGLAPLVRWESWQGLLALGIVPVVVAAWRLPRRRVLVFLLTAGAVVAAGTLAQALYYSDKPEWREYLEFSDARGAIHEEPAIRQVDRAVLEQVGWSDGDLAAFDRWFFTDPTVFPLAEVQAVAAALPAHADLHRAITAPARLVDSGLEAGPAVLLLALVGLAWAESATPGRVAAALTPLLVIATAAGAAFFAKSPPWYVAAPLVAGAGWFLIARPASCGFRTLAAGRGNPAGRVLTAAVLATLLAFLPVLIGRSSDNDEAARALSARLEGLAALDPEGTFISWGPTLGTKALPPLETGGLPGPDLIPLGWQERSPVHEAWLASHGIGDLALAIAGRSDVYVPLPEEDPSLRGTYLRYLQEHYGFQGLLRPLARVGELVVYQGVAAWEIEGDRFLIERGIEGVISRRPLVEAGPADRVFLVPLGQRTLVIGETTAPLVVITRRGESIAAALPDRSAGPSAGTFAVAVRAEAEYLRVFALPADGAADLTP